MMFVKLDKTDVYSITCQNGRDEPTGDVYINIKDISHIDGHFIIVDGYVFYCSDAGLEKVLSTINIVGTPEDDAEAELQRLFDLADEREKYSDWFRNEFCKECE